MKEVLFILLIATSTKADGGLLPGLRVKFDVHGTPGVDYFFKLPRTVSEANAEGWLATRRPDGPLPQLTLYCPRDKVICVLMDDTGYVSGLQIALRKDKFTDNALDWMKRGFTSWKTEVDGEPVKFWTIQEYFVSEENLKKSKEERLAARDSSRILQEGAVWFTGSPHTLLRALAREDDLENSTFTMQSCVPGMGNHYFNDISPSTQCLPEKIYPWFPLTFHGEIVGMGFITFGKLQLQDNERDWFERPDVSVIKAVTPYGPECMYDLATKPGSVTLHIYLVDDPTDISCEPRRSGLPDLPNKPYYPTLY